jgi:hypothetical protein
LSEAIQFYQAGGGVIGIQHLVDGLPIDGITSAKYQLFDRNGNALITKQLGDGITFTDGRIVVVLSASDVTELAGAFTHECAVRDNQGRNLFVLTGPIRLIATKVRTI